MSHSNLAYAGERFSALFTALRPGLALYLLLAVGLAAFWPALSGPFVFDDFPNLQNLENLQGEFSRRNIGRYLYYFNGNPGRPLAALSFLIDDASWPADPRNFKETNLLLHLLVGVLVFALTRRLAIARVPRPEQASWLALLCTAMWLLHPMQLSATMLIVQRMNIIASVFVLAGLLVYMRILRSETRQLARVLLSGTCLGAFAAVAILAKENGLLIFAYATALNLTLLRADVERLDPPQRRLLQWGVATPLVLLAILAVVYSEAILATYLVLRDFTLEQRLLTQPRILLEYFSSIVAPRLGGQGVFHDDYAFSTGVFSPPATFVAILVVLGALCSAVALRRRTPVLAFAVLWFFAGHLLESTVLGLELYFEHRNYLAMLGPLFAFAYFPHRMARGAVIATMALLVWVAFAAPLTYVNAGIWGDRGKLALTWLSENRGSLRAVQMAAGYYWDDGQTEKARDVLEDAAERMPERAELPYQIALTRCVDTGIPDAEWESLLRMASSVRYSHAIPETLTTIRKRVIANGCKHSVTTASVRDLIFAFMENPYYAQHPHAMSAFHYDLSRMALAERDLDAVIHHLVKAYSFRPNPFVAREAAIYLLSAGLPDDAVEFLDISEDTPMPAVKRAFLDVAAMNVGLRESAERMQEARPPVHNDE